MPNVLRILSQLLPTILLTRSLTSRLLNAIKIASTKRKVRSSTVGLLLMAPARLRTRLCNACTSCRACLYTPLACECGDLRTGRRLGVSGGGENCVLPIAAIDLGLAAFGLLSMLLDVDGSLGCDFSMP